MDATKSKERRDMHAVSYKMEDIVQSDCECIVNAANKSLLGGGGVDGAIHRAAGAGLHEECKLLGGCQTGEAKITKGYNLKAEWVIHTVGPIYSGAAQDAELLARCYQSALTLARAYAIRSVAFPAISTGAYGYPLHEATVIAVHSVLDWMDENDDYEISVVFSCFGEKTYECYRSVFEAIRRGE